MNKLAKDVDAYIAAAAEEARPKLVQLRKIVKTATPDAVESISYAMPYYKYHGALVGYAAFKNHIGFYVGTLVQKHKRELQGYETSKGAVRFPLDKPLPVAIIKMLLKARIQANKASK